MQAGKPLIPIVIKNSHYAMPRGANFVKPCVINVKILPAIYTDDWTLENMTEKIEEVRNLYLAELGQL